MAIPTDMLASVVELTNSTGFPRRFTCASGVAITKGTVLQLTEPRTASEVSGPEQPLCGIAAMDKSATDFSTSITAWTDGIFDVVASGAISKGAPLVSAGANDLKIATNATGAFSSGASIIGYALEDAAANITEKINVRVKL